jgi:hypothetical protein
MRVASQGGQKLFKNRVEESTALGAIPRQQPMKTQQTEKT